MKEPVCDQHGCTMPARWSLLPGFQTGKGRRLCSEHWQEICRESPVQGECYAPISQQGPLIATKSTA